MRKQSMLFDDFNQLTNASEETDLTDEIARWLVPHHIIQNTHPLRDPVLLSKGYRDIHRPLTTTDIDDLETKPVNEQRAAIQLLRKIGRIQVLDISEEVSRLREIKDIEDELNIMSIVFEDQKTVLSNLERVILSKAAVQTRLEALEKKFEDPGQKVKRGNLNPTIETPPDSSAGHESDEEGTTVSNEQITVDLTPMVASAGEMSNAKGKSSEEEVSAFDTPNYNIINNYYAKVLNISNQNGESYEDRGSAKQIMDSIANRLLETKGDTKQRISPLAIVETSIDEIERMFERAKKANRAVCCFLSRTIKSLPS